MSDADAVREIAKSYLGAEPRFVRDLKARAKWALTLEPWLVTAASGETLLVVTGGEGRPSVTPLPTPEGRRPAALNLLLASSGTRPRMFTAQELATTVRVFTQGLGAIILGPEVLAGEQGPLELIARTDEARKLLDAECRGPRVDDVGAGWTLRFSALVGDGSVERFTVTGDAVSVTTVQKELGLPPRTFVHPSF